MLDFWYSERCTRQVKLIVSIMLCIVIFYCSNIEKLSPIFVGIGLVLGMALHVLYRAASQKAAQNPQKKWMKIAAVYLPIFIQITIIYWFLKQSNFVYLAIQALGFMMLGLVLISNYQNRSKCSD
ncbi:hypothetical protein HX005_00610 [Acinetobacter sp. R933-2]|uniref:hypothetical protein n=1 Tax=Acinetobacter sp. R933-2 TaxID=2746728 RepID=UPI0025770B4A|nr:hypothetical protein [Acinetobacter sp. R933-2]MDM1245906.1 hypothetical protein [Acinetobacter sp. R933-2]